MNKPPTCNLTKLIESHILCVHKFLAAGCDNFAPTLLVEYYDPFGEEKTCLDVLLIAGDFNDHEDKHTVMETCGAKYYKEQHLPIGIALASEAWMSHTPHCMPRDADDRREVLMIAAKSIQGECIFEQMPITRDKKGHIIEAPFVRLDWKADMRLLDHFYKGFFVQAKEFASRR